MLARRYSVTFLTFGFFLLTLWHDGMLFSFASVSPETATGVVVHAVKQGVTQNGLLSLTEVVDAPSVPPRLKMGNHPRTLRAFTVPNQRGALVLYVESVRPHTFYVVTGNIILSTKYPILTWVDSSTIEFYGSTPGGPLSRVRLNVYTLSTDIVPTDESAILSVHRVPFVDADK